MAVYVADSNFFIQAHRQYYPIDVVPGFWLKLIELANKGVIICIDKVRNELILNNDDLTTWVTGHLPTSFFHSTNTVVTEYATVTAWANSRSSHYVASALAEFLHVDEADAWLVSYAMRHSYKIITHEKSEPNRKAKIKIPEPCNHFGISFVNTIDFFREIGETF